MITECGNGSSANSVLLFIPPRKYSRQISCAFVDEIVDDFRTFVLTSPLPPENQVLTFAEQLSFELRKQKVKRLTVFGLGEGAYVAQALAVALPRTVRHMILVDGTTRLAPGYASRFIQWVEWFLPLGLPLRRLSDDFDSRPFLHRIHCPALVVLSKNADKYICEQGRFIATKIPNAWLTLLSEPVRNHAGHMGQELAGLLGDFLQIPRKRPQQVAV